MPGVDSPANVIEAAEACRGAVRRALAFELDFAPETLPVLDHYLSTSEARKDGVLHLVATMAGAYFGETVRRTYECEWHAPAGDTDSWRLEFQRCFLHFNPVATAREAILRDDAHDGESAFGLDGEVQDAVEAKLAALPPVAREDYYRLATRFEVLAIVIDALLAGGRDVRTLDAAYYAERLA